jgi:hypothetical protein
MTEPPILTVYTDYKSPCAYLANDLAYDLACDLPMRLDPRPTQLSRFGPSGCRRHLRFEAGQAWP